MTSAVSGFDKAVRTARESLDLGGQLHNVQLLLATAGVHKDKIKELIANPSIVAMIKANPDLARQLAQKFPSSYAISYEEVRIQAGLGPLTPEQQFMSGGPDAMARNILTKEGRTSPTGAIEYPGGVIVQDDQVFFPPTDASVAGSPAWMAQIPRWGEAKQQSWAKTLFDNGYLDSKNPNLVQLTDALRAYHETRYLYGGGEPVNIKEAQRVTKQDFGGLLDKAVLGTEVDTWFDQFYGEPPTEEEREFWTSRLATKSIQLARRRDLDPADAAAVAGARTHRRMSNTPEAQEFARQAHEEEENTGLRDSLLSIAQVIGV